MGAVAFSTAQRTYEIGQSELEEIASLLGEQSRASDALPRLVNAPFARGKMLARQLQPGLFVTAYDLEYLEDRIIEVDEDPSVRCGIMFEGPARPLEIAGVGQVATQPHCPFVIGNHVLQGLLRRRNTKRGSRLQDHLRVHGVPPRLRRRYG